MRPLHHPAARDVTVEGLLHALSDPVRVRILASIESCEGGCICSDFLTLDNRTLPKSTLSQHFKVLRESGLIHSERKGVEIHNTTRRGELNLRFGAMLKSIMNAYGLRRSQLGRCRR